MIAQLRALAATFAENWRRRTFERHDPRDLHGDALMFWIRVSWK